MSEPTRAGGNPSSSVHRPVLVREVLQYLDLQPGLIIVDGTVGGGGHSRAILPHIGPSGKLIALDRDPQMLARASQALADPRCTLRQANYAELPDILDELGIAQVDRVLLDLGLASDQLADPQRGFSFQGAATLDMRFDTTQGRPAWELLETCGESELAELLFRYGEERGARVIAKTIVNRRRTQPVRTAADLADAVLAAVPATRRSSDTHPATRVFQALRIAVNRELDHLDTVLKLVLPERLKPGGRAVVLSFHSLEDRLIKDAFRDQKIWQNLTPKPVMARTAEQRMNPRSRSAKLRAAVRKEPPMAP